MTKTPLPRTAAAAAALALAAAMSLAPAAAQDGPFVINAAQVPATIDPAFVCDIADNGYVSPLYAPLLTYPRRTQPGPDGVTVTAEDDSEVIGALAESYSVSDDGLTITLVLREGLRFASGNTLDADAVVASLTRALNSGACGTYFMEAAQFGNTQSIEATDARTVVITLATPEPLVIHALTQPNLGIVDVAAVEAAGGGDDWLASNAAGSGPYVLESYQPGTRAVFSANPHYYAEPPIEPEVVLNFVTDPSALLLQARNRAAHVTLGLPRQMLASAAAAEGLQLVSVPTARWLLVGLPHRVAPFDNPTFRAALSHATPYDAILQSVAFGRGELFFGPFPPEFAAFNPDLGAPRAFDLDRAAELLAESGVSGRVPLTMTVREGQEDQERIATILQGVWSQLGVDVTISRVSASAYAEAISAPEKTTAIVRFDGPSVTDPAWLLNYDLRCESAFNMSNYCSEEAEALLDAAVGLSDPEARQEYWDRIAEIWVRDAPRIPLFADEYTAVLSTDVTRWDFAQDGPFEIQLWGR